MYDTNSRINLSKKYFMIQISYVLFFTYINLIKLLRNHYGHSIHNVYYKKNVNDIAVGHIKNKSAFYSIKNYLVVCLHKNQSNDFLPIS